jgi:short-subunit dehydrogenase
MSKVQTALVTGASGGIGLEIAKLLAADGYNLVLVARSKDALENLAEELRGSGSPVVTVLPEDLLDAEAPTRLAAELAERGISLDMLVNNAGVLEYGRFQDLGEAEQLRMLALNNEALVRMTYKFLPGFLAQGSGGILNVASIAAFQPVPMLAVYAATKAFVLSFTEALSVELEQSGVKMTALCPGVTDTDMVSAVSKDEDSGLSIPSFARGNPVDVAKAGLKALKRGQVIVVPGIANKMAVNSVRMTPKWAFRKNMGLVTRFLSRDK